MDEPPRGSSGASEPRDPAGTDAGKKDEAPSPMALLGVGAEVGLTVAALVLMGWWLDRKWGTTPLLILVGAGFGIVGGMLNLWRQSRKYFR